MNDINSDRSKQPWNIYTSSDPTPAQTGVDHETPLKSFGTSMNAISFGFVATAILISMFLIMAIFEHLFKPSPPFSSPDDVTNGSLESGTFQKLGNPQTVSTSYASDFSVVMPGQQYPTYIAQPAPLPCQREGTYWPHHNEHSFVLP
ncbi:multidrug resistance protein [Parasponia andersonii]|uniref:Multidrug resistance protein n=1 Tax=Parasponia andersonii TaxID=3476 RepID=A0A2P5BIZ0_PARAD|nr:multidrug resistance protein [Parasponia andersonii]